MKHIDITKIIELRQELHSCAEVSGHEVKSRKMLMTFIQENTSMDIRECGDGFYAVHSESSAADYPEIALRADYDALATPGGCAAHLCGHDGHAAGLCAVALMLEGETVGKNIFLLFQPGEENGTGAKSCCEIFDKERIDEIYGLHNLPGYRFGQVLTRYGSFACASRGLTIRLTGKPTHAAYPENGISPANAVGQVLCSLKEISNPAYYTAMTMCTVIGVNMGEKAFGAAAEKAEIWLTLRGERDKDIELIQTKILSKAREAAMLDKLEIDWELEDVFPSTENTDECVDKVLDACNGIFLEEPMRWSEDFGYYTQHVKGAYLGIGAGEEYPHLHTENYEYPDELLEPSAKALYDIIRR